MPLSIETYYITLCFCLCIQITTLQPLLLNMDLVKMELQKFARNALIIYYYYLPILSLSYAGRTKEHRVTDE